MGTDELPTPYQKFFIGVRYPDNEFTTAALECRICNQCFAVVLNERWREHNEWHHVTFRLRNQG